MTLLKLIVAAGLTVSAIGMSTSAEARWHPNRGHHGWNNGHHGGYGHHGGWGRHCRWIWRHHHRVRVCR